MTTFWSNPVQADSRDIPTSIEPHVNTPAFRIVGNGEAEAIGTTHFNMSHAAPQGEGILATAQSTTGAPPGRLHAQNTTVELVPGVPSSRTTLAVAEQLGYVRRGAGGGWEVSQSPKPGSLSAVNEAEEAGNVQENTEDSDSRDSGDEDSDSGPELFDRRDEQVFGHMIAEVPQPLYDRMAVKAALAVAESGSVEGLAQQVAQAMGGEPAEAERLLAAGMEMFSKQAAHALDRLNIVPDEFFTWARENRNEALVRAAVGHVTTRSLSGYRALAEDYLRSTRPTEEALQARGFATQQDAGSGKSLVRINGQWLEIVTAAKMGWL